MSLKDDLLGAARRTAGLAGKQVFAGLNRADELGGELRDYCLSRTDRPLLRKLGERLARLGGVRLEDDSRGTTDYEKHIASQTVAAPPPTAAEITERQKRKGLGDPDIAAQIYGRDSCPWSGRSRSLLNNAKIDYDFVNLDDSEHRHLEGALTAETKQGTIPYVFLRGEFVGGFNELSEVVRLGQLEYRTMTAEDRKAADATRRKVEIAPRERTGAPAPGETDESPPAKDHN